MACVSSPSLRALTCFSSCCKGSAHQGDPKWGVRAPLCGREAGPLCPCHRVSLKWVGEGVGSVTSLPLARAKPPPRRSTIFQGIFSLTIFQLRRAGGAFSFSGFPTPQAEEDGSPRANRLSSPSLPPSVRVGPYQSLMHGREGPSVLQHHDFVPESLRPWQITPASPGLVYSCRVRSKGRHMPEGGVCPEALLCPRPGAYLVPESALGSWRAR